MATAAVTLPFTVESQLRFVIWALAVMPVVMLAVVGLLFLLGEIGPEILLLMPMVIVGDVVVLYFFGVVLKKRPYDEMYELTISSQLVEMTPFRPNMFGPDKTRKMSCFNVDLAGLSIREETMDKERVFIVCLNGVTLQKPVMVQRFETAGRARDFAADLAGLMGTRILENANV